MFLKPIPSNSHAHEYLTKDHVSFKTVSLDLEDGLSSGASLPVYHMYSFMLWFPQNLLFSMMQIFRKWILQAKWPVTLTKSDEIQSVWIKSHKNLCLTQLTVVVFTFFLLLLFCCCFFFWGGYNNFKTCECAYFEWVWSLCAHWPSPHLHKLLQKVHFILNISKHCPFKSSSPDILGMYLRLAKKEEKKKREL